MPMSQCWVKELTHAVSKVNISVAPHDANICKHMQPHPLSVIRIFWGWCCRVFIFTHTCTLADVWVFHVIAMDIHMCAVLPCLFLLYPPSLFLFLSTTWSLWVNVHNSCNESMDPTDEFSLCTGYETKAHDFDEFSVEPYVQLLDSPPLFSWKVSSSDPAYDDNALEDMLHQAHREQSYHSPREDFSVSLSSIMSTEEGVLLEIDWSDSVSTEAQIRTLLDNQKEQILAECQARSNQHEFQAARAEDEQQLLQWSMGGETCQIFGQVSHNVLYSTKKLLTDILGPGGD